MTVQSITGRACGRWISKERRNCTAPIFYRCPVCSMERCLDHSPPGQSPSKRGCCYGRILSEGEVQAWRGGDIDTAVAIAIRYEVRRRLGVIGLGLQVGGSGKVSRGDVAAAQRAAGAWMQASERYFDLSKIDPLARDEHALAAIKCAENSILCAGWAKEWIAAVIDPAAPITKSRGGLTLVSPRGTESDKVVVTFGSNAEPPR